MEHWSAGNIKSCQNPTSRSSSFLIFLGQVGLDIHVFDCSSGATEARCEGWRALQVKAMEFSVLKGPYSATLSYCGLYGGPKIDPNGTAT